MRNIFVIFFRFLWLWVFNALCLLLCTLILPGITITPNPHMPMMVTVMAIGFVFTLMNLLIRPIILLLTIPINGVTFGLFSLIVNALVLLLVQRFSNLFRVATFIEAFYASFIIALVNIFISILIPIDDDLLYHDILSKQIRRRSDLENPENTGIVVLEIDGLSYSRFKNSVNRRQMSFLKELLDSGKYAITRVDCGIPSQTSSCQAGIMYGNNFNICAYRWFDKKNRRMISSGSFQDADYMEQRILSDQTGGLLDQGGMSINNLMSGNASVSLFTVSSIQPKNPDDKNRRNLSLYFFSLNPYLLTKSIINTLVDAVVEMIQYGWAVIRRKEPRLKRLRHFYPLLRGATNVLLRDISTTLTMNEIARGGPATYTTFYGYDEIAHHSGPDSFEALHALVGIDRSIRKIHHTIDESTERQYEMFILSDHGQSFGKTFKQRYGVSLGDFINEAAQLSANFGTSSQVIGIGSHSDNESSLLAALTTLSGQEQTQQMPLSKKTITKLETVIESDSDEALVSTKPAVNDIWVLVSGNLANVYFTFAEEKVNYESIESHYPTLCDRIIRHPGIGVMILEKDGQPWAIGKNGSRNLITNEIKGFDPLLNYTAADVRAAQLSYLSSFPDGGDVVLFSTLYPDGTVAAFEELIGSHGGMGGDQNEAFIFHPASIEIPADIINSNEVYEVLKARREVVSEKEVLVQSEENRTEEWSWKNLLKGIKDTKHWTPLARDVILFQSSVYRKISLDPTLNGPALLLSAFSLFVTMLTAGLLVKSHDGLMSGAFIWLITWAIIATASYGAISALRKAVKWDVFIRCLMFTTVFDFIWLGALFAGYRDFWFLIISLFRLISVSMAIYGITNIQGRKTLLILPAVLIMSVLVITGTYLVSESLGYLLNIEPLIQFIGLFDKTLGIP